MPSYPLRGRNLDILICAFIFLIAVLAAILTFPAVKYISLPSIAPWAWLFYPEIILPLLALTVIAGDVIV